MTTTRRTILTGAALAALAACSRPSPAVIETPSPGPTSGSVTPTATPTPSSSTPSPTPTPTPSAIHPSIADYFDRLPEVQPVQVGTVRERTSAYTSTNVTYRSAGLTISGVLNVPRGTGPFPAVILAHGWIDRDR